MRGALIFLVSFWLSFVMFSCAPSLRALRAADAPPAPRTRADLVADIEAGQALSGNYKIDRPVFLFTGRATAIGDPVRRASIHSTGTALVAGMAEPMPLAEMWMPDGGLHLRTATGPWRIAFPYGQYSYPGRSPGFWSDLAHLEIEITCSFAAWGDAANTANYVLCGITSADDGRPAPIAILTGLGYLAVQLSDATGLKAYAAKLPNREPGSKRTILVTLDRGTIKIAIDGVVLKEGAYAPPIRENIDGIFMIGSDGRGLYEEYHTPGDMTLYGFRMSTVDGLGRTGGAKLTMPTSGDWFCKPDGMLIDPTSMRKNFASPKIRIENLDITADDRMGANIATGLTQHDISIKECTGTYGNAGIGMLQTGVVYTISVDGFAANLHYVAAAVLNRPVMFARQFLCNRPYRDGIILRGGELNIDGGFVGPAGSMQTAFRILPFGDPVGLSVNHFMVDDEGNAQSLIAYILADARATRFATDFELSFSHCTFGINPRFAKLLANAPPAPGGRLLLDAVKCQVANPAIDAAPGWLVDGALIGR